MLLYHWKRAQYHMKIFRRYYKLIFVVHGEGGLVAGTGMSSILPLGLNIVGMMLLLLSCLTTWRDGSRPSFLWSTWATIHIIGVLKCPRTSTTVSGSMKNRWYSLMTISWTKYQVVGGVTRSQSTQRSIGWPTAYLSMLVIVSNHPSMYTELRYFIHANFYLYRCRMC